MNLDPGTVVQGRFRIDRAISAGGMGEVYRALDQRDGGAVAFKRMLLENFADDERELIERKFDEEVQVLQRLDYPGIPRFVADFVHENTRCIVMEFIQGTDLEGEVRDRYNLVQERGLPISQAVETAIQICKIVEYLHAMRPHPIIHRDIKPANVIRRHQDGRIYLVDFGLARNVRESEAKQTKTMVGTVGYAPLEQFQGKPEQRSDQYSIAVTLQYLITAESPIPFQVPTLDKQMPHANPELVKILRRATLTEMDLRYPSVYDLRRELERVLPMLPDSVQRGGGPPPEEEEDTHKGDWRELISRGQRQRIEGVHREAGADGLDGFGTSDPLANQRQHDDFTRAAHDSLKGDRYASEAKDPPSRRRWVRGALLLAALLLLLGSYQLTSMLVRPGWAMPLLDASEQGSWEVAQLAGVFQASPGAGLGLTHPLPLGLLEKVLPPHQAGVVFARKGEARSAAFLQVELAGSHGNPTALVFAGNKGILLTRRGETFQAESASVSGTRLGLLSATPGKRLANKGNVLKLPLGLAPSRIGAVILKPTSDADLVLRGLKLTQY